MVELSEAFRILGSAFESFIDEELSGKFSLSNVVFDDSQNPIKLDKAEDSDEERAKRPAIQVHRNEKIVFINWMEMFKRMPDLTIKDRFSSKEQFEKFSYSTDVSEMVKFFGMLIDDNQNFANTFQTNKEKRKWEVRFYNFPYMRRITDISSEDRNLLVTLKGLPFVRGNQVLSEPEAISWKCAECLSPVTQLVKRGEKTGKFKKVCTNFIGDPNKPDKQYMCKSTSWIGGEVSKYKNYFNIQIEATLEDTPNKLEPPVFSLEFCDNICSDKFLNEIYLSSAYRFTGIIKMKERTDKQGQRYDIPYMEVMSFDEIEKKKFDLNISEVERNQIIDFMKKPDSLPTVGNMMGQRVIGFKREKKMFILSKLMQECFNRHKGANPKNYIMHLLIVGNFGQGKSELVEAFQEICNNPYHILGASTSGVGLGGVTVKDEITGTFGIQAGVLARASGETLVIEEYDKTQNKGELGLLTESMSSFTYTITKGGKHRKFKSNTQIVMVANPEKKVFDESMSLIPQIDITGDLLSRFSTISCILSSKDVNRDLLINKAMIQRSNDDIYQKDLVNAEFIKKCISIGSEKEPKMDVPEVIDYINNFTKQTHVLSKQTFGSDKDFYSGLTPRHRMSLIKMVKAVAMWHLHPVPTKEDMDEAYGLLAEFWKEFLDKPTFLDMREIEQGMSMVEIEDKVKQKITDTSWDVVTEEKIQSKQGKMEMLLEFIDKECEKKEMIPYEQVIQWATETLGYSNRGVEEIISKMLTEGELTEPRNGFLKPLK